jgi:hypothetical protein
VRVTRTDGFFRRQLDSANEALNSATVDRVVSPGK